jgi:hypothetical protein
MKQLYQISAGIAVGLLVLLGSVGLLPAADRAEVVYAAPVLSSEDGTRDTITPVTIVDSAITQTLAAASGDGHKFRNNGREIIVVSNGYTATITMTIVTGGSVGGHSIDDVDVTLTVGATKMAGPFRTAIFNQPSGSDAGRIYLNWNATVTGTVADSVTLAVYTVPPL